MKLTEGAIVSLAERMQARLQEAGLTQQQLANKLGISQSQVCRAVKGEFKKPNEPIIQICEFLGVKLDLVAKRSGEDEERIARCALEIWDGTQADADRVIALLRDIAALRQR